MINVAICDDDVAMTGIIENMIREVCKITLFLWIRISSGMERD